MNFGVDLGENLQRRAIIVLLLVASACKGTANGQPPRDVGIDAGRDASPEASKDAEAGPSPDTNVQEAGSGTDVLAGSDGGITGGNDAARPSMDASPPPDSGISPFDVLQHHKSATRDGVYVDAAFTKDAASHIHRDLTFVARYPTGYSYAQPLYFSNGPAGRPVVFVATIRNQIIAFDAADGHIVWQRIVGPEVQLGDLPCGNIEAEGIIGTPVVDPFGRTIYFDALTSTTPPPVQRHLIYALSIDDGSTRPGWPVDTSGLRSPAGYVFDAHVQGQRGALTLLNGVLYVPYGGRSGDCGEYHGWVVGVPIANPAAVTAWSTRSRGGGIWAPGGIASDGTSLFVATGNSGPGAMLGEQESVIRLQPGPVFSMQTADFFAPTNWTELDANDLDLGSSNPVVFDLPAPFTPSKLVAQMHKDGGFHLIDRTNLGGVSPGVARIRTSTSAIITAPAVYTSARGSFIAFRADLDVGVVRMTATSSLALTPVWTRYLAGRGDPMITMTDDQGSNAIVWAVSANDEFQPASLKAFDAETGAILFAGGGPGDQMMDVQHFQIPIAVDGRIFVAGNELLWAFTVR